MQRAGRPSTDPRRNLPSVESLLSSEPFVDLSRIWSRDEVKREVVAHLAAVRRASEGALEGSRLAEEIGRRIEARHRLPLRRVLNGTGVLIHTNLGRSPIGAQIWRDAEDSTRYANLEFDLDSGERGRRDELISGIASQIFGCEAAILVNNNAAAVLLLLSASAKGREVVVSRSELVEIGGAFRVPEIVEQGGAKLREVGTTNRTRAADYEGVCGRKTAALLVVHQSNFRIVGFTEAPALEELVEVSKKKRVPLFVDEGSGRIVDLGKYGLAAGATIREMIASGVDAVTASTDKLIGATQGGLIIGKREIIDRCARHPLLRAVRAGKESYAVVGRTLQSFLRSKQESEIELYRMLAAPLEELRMRATAIASKFGADVIESASVVGGGTTPGETVPSVAIAMRGEANRIAEAARNLSLPLIGMIENDRFRIDLRSIAPEDDAELLRALEAAMR